MKHNHDKFFGETFSIPAIALESIRMVLPESVLEKLDLDNMKLEESKFTSIRKNSIADIIWAIPIKEAYLKDKKNGTVEVVLLFEHKSNKPQEAMLQLSGYMFNYWKRQDNAKKPLSPIIPIVVYIGKAGWKVKQFHEMFTDVPDFLQPYLLNFTTLVLQTSKLKITAIKKIANPLTQVVFSLLKNALADKKALETETLTLLQSLFQDEATYQEYEKGIGRVLDYLLTVTDLPMEAVQEKLLSTPLNKPLMSTIERYLAQETKDLRSAVKEERHQKEEAQREKEEAQRKQEEERRQKEEAQRKQEEALQNSVKGFLKFGATKQQIAKELNLPLKEVERIVYELGL
jgi:hypothetical protein